MDSRDPKWGESQFRRRTCCISIRPNYFVWSCLKKIATLPLIACIELAEVAKQPTTLTGLTLQPKASPRRGKTQNLDLK